MLDRLDRWKPAVGRKWLLLVSGLLWSGVGAMLGTLAYGWLASIDLGQAILPALAGVALAFVIGGFGFSKIARKNIHRIDALVDRVCIFAFQAWKGYLIIAVMMAMGIMLRHSPIPKPYLAVLYIGIGGGLFLASLRYYGRFLAAQGGTC